MRTEGGFTQALLLKKDGAGFTLVELLVVITIIGILSVVGITMYSGVQSRARDTQRLDDARQIIIALEQFRSGAGRYPYIAGCPANVNGWCSSQNANAQWFPEVDITNFKDNKIPIDPRNVRNPELLYYYNSNGTDDYCLQISQENNATGHPYYKGQWNGSWKLRFGPKGANSGVCNQ